MRVQIPPCPWQFLFVMFLGPHLLVPWLMSGSALRNHSRKVQENIWDGKHWILVTWKSSSLICYSVASVQGLAIFTSPIIPSVIYLCPIDSVSLKDPGLLDKLSMQNKLENIPYSSNFCKSFWNIGVHYVVDFTNDDSWNLGIFFVKIFI